MSFIQQFFTSRDNNANAETFVGQEGRLWWDPVTNQIYSSDGNTPGGIPLAGGGGGNGSPGGSNSQVQFNQAGNFGGSANLTFNSVTGALTTASLSTTGNVNAGNINVGTAFTGNILPSLDNTYFLGDSTHRWADIWLGPGTIYITDTANTANVAELTVSNGILFVNGAAGLQANLIAGNTSLTLSPNGPIVMSVGGVANIWSVNSTGVQATGTLSVVGNINNSGNTTSAYYFGNGSQLTGIVATASNTAVTVTGNAQPNITSVGTLTSVSVSGNVQGGNLRAIGGIIAGGEIFSATQITGGNINGANIVANGYLCATGNITTPANIASGNLSVTGSINLAGRISAVGNITGGNLLTGANVSATGNVTGGNVISNGLITTVGNVVANYFVGNGSALFAIAGANVTGTVANATYAVSAGSATTATTAGTVTTNAQPNITSVGTLTSITSTGNISTTGNVTGNYYFGNGSQLTGITAIASNTAVTVTGNAQPNITSVGTLTSVTSTGNISTAGNVISNYLIASGGNTVINSDISTTGNIVATYFKGDGSLLTGIAPTVQVYEFANVTSGISTYLTAQWLADYTPGAVANIVTTVGTTGTLLASFITQAGYPNVTVIPVGTMAVTIELTKALGSKSYIAYAQIYKRTTGGTETLIATTDNSNAIAVNTAQQITLPAYFDTPVTLNATDRIVTKIYAYTSQGTDSLTFKFEDNTGTGLQLPALPASASSFVPYNNPTANLAMGTYGVSGAFFSTTGNVTGNYFIGNGSQLTSLTAANITGNVANATYALSANSASSLVNGSSSVLLNSDGTMVFPGNVINSNANPITLWSTNSSKLLWRDSAGGAPGQPVQTTITAGNGTATITVSTGVLAVQSAKTWTFDTAGNVTFPDATVQTTAYPGTATSLSVTGNVTGGNINTAGQVSATGNITGGNIIGTHVGNITGTTASLSGNVTGGNILTGGLISATGNATAGNISTGGLITATANITGGNLLTAGILSSTGNATFGNISTAGVITATGNITVGNVNTSGRISATGNLLGGNLTVTGNAVITYAPATAIGTGLLISAANSVGGAGYGDVLRFTNASGGATNPNKTFRLNSVGTLEILNSAYANVVFSVTDAGFISVATATGVANGIPTNNGIAMNNNSYIYDDGNYHLTSKVGTIWLNANDGSAININTQMPTGITGGGLNVQGAVKSYGAGVSTAFISSGANVVSGVALQLDSGTAGTAAQMAIRDTSTVASTMYFDVSTGGSAHGSFQFRSSNAFSQLLALSNSQVAVNRQMLIGGGSQGAYVTISGTNSYNLGGPYGYLNSGGAGSVGSGGSTGVVAWSLQSIGRIQSAEIDVTSDERLKDIQGTIPLDRALQFVRVVDGILYTWKPGFGDEGIKAGFGAQSVHKAGFDHMVAPIPNDRVEGSTDADGFTSPDKAQLTLNYLEAIPYHHEVIKHLLDRVEQLEATIAKLTK